MIDQYSLSGSEQALMTRKPCPVCCSQPARRGGRYCSNACKQKAYRERKAQHNTRNVTPSEQSHAPWGLILDELQALRAENAELRNEIAQIKHLTHHSPVNPTMHQISASQTNFSDLEDTMMVQAVDFSKSGENPTYNMLISVASIDATGFIGLNFEVLEYGVKQGKIDPVWLEKKRSTLTGGQTKPKQNSNNLQLKGELDNNPRVIAGANVQLGAPNLDDGLDLSDW